MCHFLLAFSLVYFVGLDSQTLDKPFSSKCQIIKAFHIPIKTFLLKQTMLGCLTEKILIYCILKQIGKPSH